MAKMASTIRLRTEIIHIQIRKFDLQITLYDSYMCFIYIYSIFDGILLNVILINTILLVHIEQWVRWRIC